MRALASCLLSVVMAATLCACQPGEAVTERVDAARERNDGPAIWVATDADSTVYLYGTIHLMPIGLDWQRDDMVEAFGRSGTVLFEVPSTDAARTAANRLTQQLGFLGLEEGRLSEGFDAYETKLLEAAALQADVPLEALDTMRPWLASDILLVAAADRAGLSPELSADEALKSLARRQRKNVQYLDTMEEQIALSAEASPEAQSEALRDTLVNYNRLAPVLARIADAWVVGDTARLERLTREPLTDIARERLFTARNDRWADRIAELMEGSGTAFVAVGVGHLVGEDSLQAALKARGIEVERFLAFQGETVIRTIDLDIGIDNPGP